MPGEPDPAPRLAAAPDASLLRRIQVLADAFIDDGQSAVAESDLADCLSMLERVWPGSSLGASPTPASSSATRDTWIEDAKPDFGRFLVRRLLGQGGFGAVFLVFDATLGRDVALKIPQPSLLGSSEVRHRFVREAQAAALLDHPHIVPVYESGEVGAMWYIVSRYCSGPTLAQWLADQPQPPHQQLAAKIIADLADAVHHAHSRGVLHRDLKPSNVLLEPVEPVEAAHQAFAFIPMLTDFGLAKRLDGQNDVTRAGALLGTARYMSPEQAAGDDRAVGVQSDVYSLGVMLYELISGRPPFRGSEAETLRCIQQEPIPALTTPHGRLSRDLETVCLKCLEKNRERRYASAAELAAELRRFLAGESVLARPVSLAVRAARWCRRRPLVSGLSAALLLVLCASSIGSFVMLQRERELRRRAEWKQEFAIQAVGDFYTGVAENWLATQPHSEDLRKKYLLKALEFYEALAAEQSDDPEVRYRTSVALHRAANIQEHLRMPKEALRDRMRCVEILNGLIAEIPDERQYRYDRFYNLMNMNAGYPEGRGVALREAYTAICQLVDEEPENPVYLDALASASGAYASSLDLSQVAEMKRILNRGISIAEQLTAKYPDKPLYEKNIASCLSVLGGIAGAEGELETAAAHANRCAGIYHKLSRCFPEVSSHQIVWLSHRRVHALYRERLGDAAFAQREIEECLRLIEQLWSSFPQEVDILSQVYSTQWELAMVEHRQGNEASARMHFLRCFDFLEDRILEKPDYEVQRRHLAEFLRTCPIEELRDLRRAAELEKPPQATAM